MSDLQLGDVIVSKQAQILLYGNFHSVGNTTINKKVYNKSCLEAINTMKKYEVKKADEEYDEKFLFYKEIEENRF